MTPTEAEEIMKPFFPNNSNLAVKALSRGLNEGTTPEWIVDSIVGAYFAFLQFNSLKESIKKHDPFDLDTVPYLNNIHKENKN